MTCSAVFLYSFGSCFYLMLSVHRFPGNLNHYVGVVSIMLYCSGYRITCLPSKLNVCCSFKKVSKVKYETELQTWWLFPNRFGWSSVKNLCCSFHVFDTYCFVLYGARQANWRGITQIWKWWPWSLPASCMISTTEAQIISTKWSQ